MVTTAKGDTTSVPVSAAGRTATNEWDPDKDIAAGLQCKSYGAAGLMRVPTRLHITWADDNTLKIETDAGTQTRLLHFGTATPPAGGGSAAVPNAGFPAGFRPPAAPAAAPAGGRGGGGRGAAPGIRPGSLKIVT